MKLLFKVLSVFVIPVVLLLFSYTSGSPGGRTGSPGDGGALCTQCHYGAAQVQGGLISTNIPASGYQPGQTYTVTVSANMSGISKYGFELTAEGAGGTKKGTFTVTDPSRIKKVNSGTAVTHKAGGTAASGNTISWSTDWTAPTAGTGQVTFYTAVNATNSNGSSSGDHIYKDTYAVSEHVVNPQITGVIPDMIAQTYVGDVVISGNDTEWSGGVSLIKFKLHDNSSISFEAASFVVNSDTQITATMPSLENQQVGVYDLLVDNLMMENALTITIDDAVAENNLNSIITVFPNPSVNYITVKGLEGATLKIVDLSGRVFKIIDNIKLLQNVSVKDLNSGIYFAVLTKGETHVVKKFIVKTR